MKHSMYFLFAILNFILTSCGWNTSLSQPLANETLRSFLRAGIFENEEKTIKVTFDNDPESSTSANIIQYFGEIFIVKTFFILPDSFFYRSYRNDQSLPQPFKKTWVANFKENSISLDEKIPNLKRTGCVGSICSGIKKYKVSLVSGRCELVGEGARTKSCE